jgi:hypothetical protein
VAILTLKNHYELSCREFKADHRKRRALVYHTLTILSIHSLIQILQVASLGLRRKPYSILDLLAGQADIPGMKIIWRERSTVKPGQAGYIRSKSVLSDTNCCPGTDDVVVNETTGFYVVRPDESVIFVSGSSDFPGEFSSYNLPPDINPFGICCSCRTCSHPWCSIWFTTFW